MHAAESLVMFDNRIIPNCIPICVISYRILLFRVYKKKKKLVIHGFVNIYLSLQPQNVYNKQSKLTLVI